MLQPTINHQSSVQTIGKCWLSVPNIIHNILVRVGNANMLRFVAYKWTAYANICSSRLFFDVVEEPVNFKLADSSRNLKKIITVSYWLSLVLSVLINWRLVIIWHLACNASNYVPNRRWKFSRQTLALTFNELHDTGGVYEELAISQTLPIMLLEMSLSKRNINFSCGST